MSKPRSHIFSIIAMIGAFLGLGAILFFANYPFKTFEIKGPITVTNSPVKAGGFVQYKINSCRYTTQPAAVTRTLVGKVNDKTVTIPLNQQVTRREVGCAEYVSPFIPIPVSTPTGTYHIVISNSVNINSLNRQDRTYTTQDFQIVNDDPQFNETPTILNVETSPVQSSQGINTSKTIYPTTNAVMTPVATIAPTPADTASETQTQILQPSTTALLKIDLPLLSLP